MKIFNLFYLTDVRFGGFHSYTLHLYKSLQDQGITPMLYKIGKRSEKTPRDFGAGVQYLNVTLDDAVNQCRASKQNLITCCYQIPEAARLLEAGAGIVLHDPTEFKPELLAAIKAFNKQPMIIREANRAALEAEGFVPHFIPHPYKPVASLNTPDHRKNACALSRLDFDKHTDIIIAANMTLPADKRVEIFGAENRMYTHLKLDKAFPVWRAFYHGRFPHAVSGAQMACEYKFMVDMSAIKGDGGGTQYTFMEAWDAETTLIVNRAWLKTQDIRVNALEEGVNTLAVDSPSELADALQREPIKQLHANGLFELRKHCPEFIVPNVEIYLDAINGRM